MVSRALGGTISDSYKAVGYCVWIAIVGGLMCAFGSACVLSLDGADSQQSGVKTGECSGGLMSECGPDSVCVNKECTSDVVSVAMPHDTVARVDTSVSDSLPSKQPFRTAIFDDTSSGLSLKSEFRKPTITEDDYIFLVSRYAKAVLEQEEKNLNALLLKVGPGSHPLDLAVQYAGQWQRAKLAEDDINEMQTAVSRSDKIGRAVVPPLYIGGSSQFLATCTDRIYRSNFLVTQEISDCAYFYKYFLGKFMDVNIRHGSPIERRVLENLYATALSIANRDDGGMLPESEMALRAHWADLPTAVSSLYGTLVANVSLAISMRPLLYDFARKTALQPIGQHALEAVLSGDESILDGFRRNVAQRTLELLKNNQNMQVDLAQNAFRGPRAWELAMLFEASGLSRYVSNTGYASIHANLMKVVVDKKNESERAVAVAGLTTAGCLIFGIATAVLSLPGLLASAACIAGSASGIVATANAMQLAQAAQAMAFIGTENTFVSPNEANYLEKEANFYLAMTIVDVFMTPFQIAHDVSVIPEAVAKFRARHADDIARGFANTIRSARRKLSLPWIVVTRGIVRDTEVVARAHPWAQIKATRVENVKKALDFAEGFIAEAGGNFNQATFRKLLGEVRATVTGVSGANVWRVSDQGADLRNVLEPSTIDNIITVLKEAGAVPDVFLNPQNIRAGRYPKIVGAADVRQGFSGAPFLEVSPAPSYTMQYAQAGTEGFAAIEARCVEIFQQLDAEAKSPAKSIGLVEDLIGELSYHLVSLTPYGVAPEINTANRFSATFVVISALRRKFGLPDRYAMGLDIFLFVAQNKEEGIKIFKAWSSGLIESILSRDPRRYAQTILRYFDNDLLPRTLAN